MGDPWRNSHRGGRKSDSSCYYLRGVDEADFGLETFEKETKRRSSTSSRRHSLSGRLDDEPGE